LDLWLNSIARPISTSFISNGCIGATSAWLRFTDPHPEIVGFIVRSKASLHACKHAAILNESGAFEDFSLPFTELNAQNILRYKTCLNWINSNIFTVKVDFILVCAFLMLYHIIVVHYNIEKEQRGGRK